MDYKTRLHNAIPGGAHTYSRGDDQYPINAPQILMGGKGAYVFDDKNNKFLDYGMGLRSVNLGYGNVEVAERVYKEALAGNNLTRPSKTELDAAEKLISLIPSVDMVKFAKHGSTVTTAALKVARAYTGRKFIAIPKEHPFFSFDDWFIGTTPLERGVILDSSSYTLLFNYNNIESLKELFEAYPNQIAGVMLEPSTTVGPCSIACGGSNINGCKDCPNLKTNFLHQVKDLCHKNGSLFILDEMITGFRWHLQGAQTYFDIEPDLCTFGKAMANGFAVAALAGKRQFMEIGGILEAGAERVFLTSTTHGAEMSALGAFLTTTEILERDNIVSHFWSIGSQLMNGFNNLAKDHGIEKFVYMEGYPVSPNFITKDANSNPSLDFRTLFVEKMLEKNVLMPYVALSASHSQIELTKTFEALEHTFNIYSKALEHGLEGHLNSPSIKPVFRKFN